MLVTDIQTQNNLRYVFLPETSGAVKLRVKASNDAYVALTNGPFESNPMTEVSIFLNNNHITWYNNPLMSDTTVISKFY